jgi:hypothetical protein
LAEYHDAEDEPTSDAQFEWDFEGLTLTKDQVREYMLEQV